MLSGARWKTDAVLSLFMGVLLVFFLGFVAIAAFDKAFEAMPKGEKKFIQFIFGAVFMQAAPLVLVHVFLRRHGTGWRAFLGLDRPDVGEALARAVAVALLALPVALLLKKVCFMALSALSDKPEEIQQPIQILQTSFGAGKQIFFALASIVLAPLTEEILHRGVLYATVKEQGYPRLALFGGALLFAAMHLHLSSLVPLAFLAVVLARLYERTGCLLVCIVAHGTFNAVNVLTVIFWREG